jgi:uncharacterized repeat protein (TIGR04138 family)
VPPGPTTAPSVWVEERDAARAREFVRTFDRDPAGGQRNALEPPWTCPKCSEVIEGQFTDCWNCQATRPDADALAPDLPGGPLDLTLHSDLTCLRCQYNLRGLTPGHRCPECGLPILRSLLEVLRHGMPSAADDLARLVHQPFIAAAPAIGYPARAVLPVCEAWMDVMDRIERAATGKDRNPTLIAGRTCLAARDRAIDYFGDADEAKAAIRNWGIHRSEDIGRIVQGLMDAGLVERPEADLSTGFDDLFNLDGLFLLGE